MMPQMKIYVGNLPYRLTDDELRAAFEPHGEIASVTVVTDQYTGESKGFAFVEMPIQAEAENAIKQLDGASLGGRSIRVSQARLKSEGRPKKFKHF
jgi:RNA recognition motif-containing protein